MASRQRFVRFETPDLHFSNKASPARHASKRLRRSRFQRRCAFTFVWWEVGRVQTLDWTAATQTHAASFWLFFFFGAAVLLSNTRCFTMKTSVLVKPWRPCAERECSASTQTLLYIHLSSASAAAIRPLTHFCFTSLKKIPVYLSANASVGVTLYSPQNVCGFVENTHSHSTSVRTSLSGNLALVCKHRLFVYLRSTLLSALRACLFGGANAGLTRL